MQEAKPQKVKYKSKQRGIGLAFTMDLKLTDLIRAAFDVEGLQEAEIVKGNVQSAVDLFASSASPQFLVIDISGTPDPILSMENLATLCDPSTSVIVIGEDNDVKLFRSLLMLGVQDYLVKPLTQSMLEESISIAREALLQSKPDAATHKSHVIGVLGIRGGMGATTVTTSMAMDFAENHNKNTVILDLDPYFGTCNFVFDIEAGRGLSDALENPNRVDSLFIDRAISRESENLAILSAETPLNRPLSVDSNAIAHLIHELKSTYEIVIVDIPRMLITENPSLAVDFDDIFLVGQYTLASARDTIRILSLLALNAANAKTHILINQHNKNENNELTRSEFEDSIERKVDQQIPFDDKAFFEAVKISKPLFAAASGSVLRAFKTLPLLTTAKEMLDEKAINDAKKLGKDSEESEGGLLSGLFKKTKDKAENKTTAGDDDSAGRSNTNKKVRPAKKKRPRPQGKGPGKRRRQT